MAESVFFTGSLVAEVLAVVDVGPVLFLTGVVAFLAGAAFSLTLTFSIAAGATESDPTVAPVSDTGLGSRARLATGATSRTYAF